VKPTREIDTARASHPGRSMHECPACSLYRSEAISARTFCLDHTRRSARFSALLQTSRFAVTAKTDRSVQPYDEAGPLRRPQRPGNQHAPKHASGTLPAIHPRELPGTAGAFTMLQQDACGIHACVRAMCPNPNIGSSQ